MKGQRLMMIFKDWVGNSNSIFKQIGASNHCDNEREQHDYYATDPKAIDDLLKYETFSNNIWECASGGGCFGTKKRAYHSQLAPTDVTKARQDYLDYISIYGKDEESERLRIKANAVDNKNNTSFISKGIDNSILDELCRVMKKINIYIWCNKNQLRQLIDYFDDRGCLIDLLTWNKSNPIPTCNNTYLSDIEYCVFARDSGVKIYGTVETKHKWFISPCNVDDKKKYIHPTIKPIERIKQFIINSIDPKERKNSIVFDCFLGSGTTTLAAKELGCQWLGIELNPTFYKIAIERMNGVDANGQIDLLNADYEQLKLF